MTTFVNSFFLSGDGKRHIIGTQFTYNDRIYPGTRETFDELGFPEVQVQSRPDPTYYIVEGVNDDGTWKYTPRAVDKVRTEQVEKARNATFATLQSSDWYFTREQELGIPVPEKWKKYRQSCRQACDSYIRANEAAQTIQQLEQIGPAVLFPPTPDSRGSVLVTCVRNEKIIRISGNPMQATTVVEGMYLLEPNHITLGSRVVSSDPTTGVITLDREVRATSAADEVVAVEIAWGE